MAIDQKDFWHGAALVAIADAANFTALNKASGKYGHYVVNHDRNLFVKYNRGTGPGEYWFTFNRQDKQAITGTAPNGHVFAVLVCGDEVITGLSRQEISNVIDLQLADAETIKVTAATGQQLRVKGPRGTLPLIARSAFPHRILN